MSIFEYAIEYNKPRLPWYNSQDYREVINDNWWWDDLSNTPEIWKAAVENEGYSRQYRCAMDSYFEGNKDQAFERFGSLASHLDGIPREYAKHHFVSNAINWLGIMHEERGDFHEALQWFELGSSHGDLLSFNIFNLTRLLIAKSHYKRAVAVIKIIQQAITESQKGELDYDFDSGYLVYLLAVEAYNGLGESEEANRSFLKFISYHLFTKIEKELWNSLEVPTEQRDYEFVQIDTRSSVVLLGEHLGAPESIKIDLVKMMNSYEFIHKDLAITALDRAKDLLPDILIAVQKLNWPKGIAESSVEIYFCPNGSKKKKRLKIHP